MFNWQLFFLLVLMCIPGIIFLVPINNKIYQNIKNINRKKTKFSERLFTVLSLFQNFMIIVLSIFIGIKLSNKTHFQIINFDMNSFNETFHQILIIITASILGAAIFLIGYYGFFRPRLDVQTIESMERLRFTSGFFGRIFYGGIVEEIICRWGLMSFFAWAGIALFGYSKGIIWISILCSGFIFAIGHLPAYFSFGCNNTNKFVLMVILLNMYAACIFGWLFWQYGLFAAVIAHMIFHLVWYPLDLVNHNKNTNFQF